MANERRHVEQLETIMDRLAESVLELSDDDTLNEASERGVDAQKEADCTRAVLRNTLHFRNARWRDTAG